MKDWLPVLIFALTAIIQLGLIFQWVGRTRQRLDTNDRDNEKRDVQLALLADHTGKLDKWIGGVDKLIEAHDEEIALLRKEKHEQGNTIYANREQILQLKQAVEELKRDVRDLQRPGGKTS